MEPVTIPVLGMSCGGCTSSVKRALERVEGVSSATATLTPAQVVVQRDSALVGEAALVSAIEKAGYEVPQDWRVEHALHF